MAGLDKLPPTEPAGGFDVVGVILDGRKVWVHSPLVR
jgi:hypothetical protein